MFLQHVIDTIESVAPLKWQEEWDNSGLQVGDRNAEVEAALLTTDITESVVDEAIRMHCDLIISHHPLLFHGLKTISGTTPQERIVAKAIRHNIAIYSSHTAMDVYAHGVSGQMADKLGLTNVRILQPNIRNPKVGLGAIGTLQQTLSLAEFLAHVKRIFDAPVIRYTEGKQVTIQTVALCGGAGADLMDLAIEQGADVYVSADFKYHEFQAAEGRIAIVDLDHWVSEHFVRELFQDLLKDHITTYISKTDYSPIKIY